jgi:hypothetical protein
MLMIFHISISYIAGLRPALMDVALSGLGMFSFRFPDPERVQFISARQSPAIIAIYINKKAPGIATRGLKDFKFI